ncbi:MAG: prepilin-type N-terminal cleavage/methylation domain-containing protein [Alphaproteobacteria bacterium]|nr:prepilin-type N-terminal cleavage/methylation domain-containing protein [Alphaproteobacteria bacterium]
MLTFNQLAFPGFQAGKSSVFPSTKNLKKMNKHKSKASTAFSLIELSIVLLIVGIIIAGITQSSRLVRQSKLKSAQNFTQSSPVNSMKGLSVWFETSQESSFPAGRDDGEAIVQWNDINPQTMAKLYAVPASGVTTTGDSAKISYRSDGINGLPSINFAGSATTAGVLALSSSTTTLTNAAIITNADPNNASAFTAFMVYKLADAQDDGTSYTVLYNGSSTSTVTGWGYHKASGTPYKRTVIANNGTVAATSAGSIALPTTQEIATITYTGYNSKSASPGTKTTNLYINGGTGFTSTANNNGQDTTVKINDIGDTAYDTNVPAQMFIGGSTSSANPWKGYISEIIIFDTVLKTQDLKDVTNYLSKKYNIPVS